jgi:5-methylcytosine-specific restriction endonuclease McrBC regulatory subunit McrC
MDMNQQARKMPMKIKDNSSKTKEECAEISGIVKKIANKTLDELEREGIFIFPNVIKDADDISGEQMVLQSYNDTYRTSNVMGFLGLGDERLVIESRFSKGNDDFFFQFLLEKVLEFPNIINLETDANQDEQLFNLLLFLFPQYLKSAARKGIFKTYIRNEYDDENIKGTIDIARHIRNNIPFTGKISYSQREYSFDNYLVELIRHTIEFIKRKPYGNRLLESVKDEVKLVVEVSGDYKPANRRKIIDLNKKNKVRHAYYHEYRDLQQLCILILQNEKYQMGAGSKKIFGILFDGAWLWEEYVNTLIGKAFYHPMNKSGKGAQWLFASGTGLIYPDFMSRDADNRIIADAKYKPINNIGNKDYLQILAYMFRFDAKQAYYLYPEADGAEDLNLILNQGLSFEKNVVPRDDIQVTKHGLRIPEDVGNYSQFVDAIKVSEEEFIRNLIV